jgi:hypothetical protein
MDVHICDFCEPLCRHLIEMLQRSEGAAIQQVSRNILKWFLHFAFRLGTIWPASPWLKAVISSEGPKRVL